MYRPTDGPVRSCFELRGHELCIMILVRVRARARARGSAER